MGLIVWLSSTVSSNGLVMGVVNFLTRLLMDVMR
jgi:hypothetical protein